jgi:WD40 repeat protein
MLTFDQIQDCEALRGTSVFILLSGIARLVASYSTPLLSNALHVYHSALITIPSCLLHRCMPMASHHSDAPLLISERPSGWGSEMKLMYDHKRVTSAAFSPDGRYLASGAEDRTIQIRDMALGPGAQPLVVQGNDSRIGSMTFSPDGQVVVSGSESSMIHVWDVSARTCRHAISGHNGSVNSVAFSPDGRLVVSGSSDHTVRVWDVLTGEQQHIMSGHKSTVLCVAFSPGGQSVVSGSRDHTVRVWNALDGTQRSVIEGHADPVTCATFSSDGRWIASGCASTLRIWDVATGSQHYVTHDVSGSVCFVEFTPDSRSVVFIDGTQFVRVWDTSTSTLQTRTIWSDYDHIVYAVTSIPTWQVIVGDPEKPVVQVWEISVEADDGEQRRAAAGHTDEVWSVACSPDGHYIVSGSKDHTIRMWDTATGAQRHVMSGHSAAMRWVAFSPNGEWIISASNDHTLRVWDAATGAHHHTMEGHAGNASSAAFSRDGQFIVSGSADQTVRLWDATTGHPRHVMSGHDGHVYAVAFSQDGLLVASGSGDKTVRLWDAAAGTQYRVMWGHTDRVWTVAFSPDGQLVASGSFDNTARVWDTATGTQWRSVAHSSRVCAVEFQPESRSIMSYDKYDIPARNAATGDHRPLFRLNQDNWICRKNPQSGGWQRVCWLPSARRGNPHAMLSNGQRVFIGSFEGPITVLDFSHVKAM